MSGWIKLHRSLLNWEWYDDANTFRLFIHLLLQANHKDKNYRGKLVKSGTLLTSRLLLSHQTGLTERQVRTSLNNLKTTNEINVFSSRKGTIIQVVKYNDYQIKDDKRPTKRPTNDQQTTSNKNVKKEKNTIKNSYKGFAHLTISKEEFDKLNQEYSKQQIEDIFERIENFAGNKKYKSLYLTAKNWLKREHPNNEPHKDKEGFTLSERINYEALHGENWREIIKNK